MIKLLFDENLPPKLSAKLNDLFPGSSHVHDCGQGAVSDQKIWAFAKAQEFTIVSKDSDFQELSVLLGAPPKVIWLRTGNCTTAYLEALLRSRLAVLQAFDKSPSDALLILP